MRLLLMIPTGYIGAANAVAATKKRTPQATTTVQGIDVELARLKPGESFATDNMIRALQARRAALVGDRRPLNEEGARLLARGAMYSGMAAPVDPFAFDESTLPPATVAAAAPGKKADLRILDPLAFAEQQKMADAIEREAMARMRRERAAIQQEATFAQRIAEEKYRGGLMTERRTSSREI